MKRTDIKAGEVYAVIRRIKGKDTQEHADSYVRVLSTDKWWQPTYYGWSGRDIGYKMMTFLGKQYRVSDRNRVVDKYPSDGTKGVLCVAVTGEGKEHDDRTRVVSTASIVGLREDFDAHAEQLRKERAERNAVREREQAEKYNRWESLNRDLIKLGLPAIKEEVIGWNGLPRISWKNYRFDGGWVMTDEDMQAIVERVAQLEEELLYAHLGEEV